MSPSLQVNIVICTMVKTNDMATEQECTSTRYQINYSTLECVIQNLRSNVLLIKLWTSLLLIVENVFLIADETVLINWIPNWKRFDCIA